MAAIGNRQRLGQYTPKTSTVLVTDDSTTQRMLLRAYLETWGYTVIEAESGKEALKMCKTHHIDLVLSDWVMPEMDGVMFCREFRALKRESYGYFILLTAKNTTDDLALGLTAGADDFLTKPVDAGELRARLEAAERVLKMQRELVEKNESITATLIELQSLYAAIDRDLEEARKLQQSLLPKTFLKFGSVNISMLLHPSGHVGGDMVGVYYISKDTIGVYALDVSGHGVGSAMMTARLSTYLSASDQSHSIAVSETSDGRLLLHPPSKIAALLNDKMLSELDTDLYATLLLAEIDLASGKILCTQAGHPNPALIKDGEKPEYIGQGGTPVGLIPGASYDSFELQLKTGDALLLYSDGFTEAENKEGQFLGDDAFIDILKGVDTTDGSGTLQHMLKSIEEFANGCELADDLSAVLIDF